MRTVQFTIDNIKLYGIYLFAQGMRHSCCGNPAKKTFAL